MWAYYLYKEGMLLFSTWHYYLHGSILEQNFQIHKLLNQKQLGCLEVNIMSSDTDFVVHIKEYEYPGGHWKCVFAWSFKFLITILPCLFLFFWHVLPPQRTLTLMSPPTISKHFQHMNFYIKIRSDKWERKQFLCKINVKYQCFLHTIIYTTTIKILICS